MVQAIEGWDEAETYKYQVHNLCLSTLLHLCPSDNLREKEFLHLFKRIFQLLLFFRGQLNLFDTLTLEIHNEWHAGRPKNCHQRNVKTSMFQNVVFIGECFNLLSRSILREAQFHSLADKQDEEVEEETCVDFALVHDLGGEIVVHSKQSNGNWNQKRSSGRNRGEDISIMLNDALCDTKCHKLEVKMMKVKK